MKPLLSSACAILLTCGLCMGQTATSRPAAAGNAAPAPSVAAAKPPATTQPASEGGKVTVVSVTGMAQRCDTTAEPKKWQPIQAGDVLSDLTIIRTGLQDSSVVLNLAGRGEVRIGAATKIGITEFRKEGALAKTSLGLKYGAIQAEVDSKTGPADFRVTTPTATLSVRGSQPQVSFGADTGTRGFSLEGILQYVGPGHSQSFHPGEGGDDRNLMPILAILWSFWAQTGDAFGLTQPEWDNLLFNHQGRGVFSGAGPTNFMQGGIRPAGRSPTSQPGYPYYPPYGD